MTLREAFQAGQQSIWASCNRQADPRIQTPPTTFEEWLTMTRLRRVKYAFRFIKQMASISPEALERTQSRHVAVTYGIEPALVKRIKARFRNELSFSGGDGK